MQRAFGAKLELLLVVLLLVAFTGAHQTLLLGGFPAEGSDVRLGDVEAGVLRIAWVVIYAFVLLLAVVHLKIVIARAITTPWLTLLVLLCLISVVWSVAPHLTLRRATGMLVTAIFGYYLAARFDHHILLKLLARALGFALVISIITILAWPEIGVESAKHEGDWRGIFKHKNHLGRYAAIYLVIILMLWTFGKIQRSTCVVGIVLAVLSLYGAQSIGAFAIIFVLGITTLFVTTLRAGKLFPVHGILLLTSALVLCGVSGLIFGSDLLSAVDRDTTVSGRTLIWSEIWRLIDGRPLLGYGYGAIWLSEEAAGTGLHMALGWTPPHGHNGYIDLWLSLGLAGLFLFGLSLTTGLLRLRSRMRSTDAAGVYMTVLFLSGLLVVNLVETQMFVEGNLLSVLYVAVLAGVDRVGEPDHTRATAMPRFGRA